LAPALTPLQQEFERVRATIRSARNSYTGLARFKLKADPNQLRRLLPLFLKAPAYRQLIWPIPKPTSYHQLGGGGIPSYGSFENELIWTCRCLHIHSSAISEFLRAKDDYEHLFLTGKEFDLRKSLDEIEKKFGVSVWLAEAKINLLQRFEGFEAQRDFCDTLYSNKGTHPLVRYLISWISYRASQDIERDEFFRLSDEWGLSGFGSLSQIFLGNGDGASAVKIQSTLSFTDMFPIVDRYLLMIKVVQAHLSHLESDHSDLNVIDTELSALSQIVSDPALDRLLFAIGSKTPCRTIDRTPVFKAWDSFYRGSYQAAIDTALDSQLSVEAVVVALSSACFLDVDRELVVGRIDPETLIFDIAKDLAKVISYASDATEAIIRLEKITLVHSNARWGASLGLVLARLKNSAHDLICPSATMFFALQCAYDVPQFALLLSRSDSRIKFFETIDPSHDSIACRVMESVTENSELDEDAQLSLPPDQLALVNANRQIRAGSYQKAAEIVQPLYARSDRRHLRCEAGILLVKSLLARGDLHGCSLICVELFHQSEAFARLLPFEALLEQVIKRSEQLDALDPHLYGSLPMVLCFDIYSRFGSSKYDAERVDAFKDFLQSNNLTYASDLAGVAFNFTRYQLVQFLKFVCVPQVLDQSLALESTQAVEEERAKILVLLGELTTAEGKPPPPDLSDELSKIRTKQVVRKTTLQLDQSKIYVNVDGIQKSLAVATKDAWRRYELLMLQQRSSTYEELQKVLEAALGERIEVLSLTLPLTEANKLFARMVLELRDLFVASKEFGLDANLSTNIRHGFVMRELRSPFLQQQLVTNKLEAASSYQPNKYWIERFTSLSPYEIGRIVESLAVFSERIDSEIESLNKQLIRLKSDQAPKGLFDFGMGDLEVQVLKRKCERANGYEEFLSIIIEYLWTRTNYGLEKIRNVLQTSVLNNLFAALQELQDSLRQYEYDEGVVSLLSASNLVRPDLRSAVDRVASWFTLSGNTEYQDYDLQIAFEAGLATVRSYYSNLSIISQYTAPEPVMMAGKTLPFLARLFSILVENSAFHSRLTSGNLKVKADARVEDRILYIDVANNLDPQIDRAALRQRVAFVNSEFGREKASQRIREEGDSGYPKIWKILAHDLGGNHAVDVSLTDQNEFLVQIMIEARGIVLENLDS